MTTPIFRTKLYFPAPRPSLEVHPRLVERLELGLRSPLTLISAPAGSGKTTLLSEWRANEGVRMPVAWLSLDANDNDPTRFLAYLVAALKAMQPGLTSGAEALLLSSDLPGPEIVATSLIVDIQDFPQHFALVLDDYHAVKEPAIHQTLNLLVENLPSQIHLVLLTRADPSLPLARLRSSGRLTEIRLPQLCFTVDESAAFLNEVMGLDPTPQQVAALEGCVEGWITGQQLAILSMRGRDSASREDFIQAFTGSHHYILDYLTEEALNRQPPEVQRFLLRISQLERLCGSLGDSLTGREDGAATLAQFERSNLFLIPLDDERRWYRYLHLFTDMLTNRLRSSFPNEIPSLQRAAANWFERVGLFDEAIPHALSAQDYAHTDRLLRWELYIAIGTVKRHTVNIFTKLDVANRTEAVAKARQMGLVQ